MQSKDLKVLVLPSFYPVAEDPLKGIFFQEQSQAISKNVRRLDIIYPELRSLKEISFTNFYKYRFNVTDEIENGIRTIRKHRVNLLRTKFDLGPGRRLWINACFNMCKAYFKRYGFPDIIHAHCAIGAGVVAMNVKNDFGIPYVLTEHATGYSNQPLSDSLIRKLRNVFLSANEVIAVSTPFKDTLSKKLNIPIHKIKVIPNFIDTDFFNLSSETEKKDSSFSFLSVCHLVSKKRLDRLIEAFTILSHSNQNIELIIAGEGNLSQTLKEQVSENKMSNKVQFFGVANREEVKSLMQQAGCFVLPSDIETFGVVLIEALSCGIPVIATRSGGPEDIVNEFNGILIDKSTNELVQAMQFMIDNKSKYQSIELRNEVISKFSSFAVSKRYSQLYCEVVN
ncbi:glycosyltransferase [Jiulongibacter sp. NS-SX5]|uniref:glycosyltransferase n=1 Tax=Jiulongibacter sp. NS-SX5 TaxID=3463854 RepID=UPI00405991E8